MTMTRVAPRPVLSGDGRAGVVVRDGSAYLFQTAGGQIDRLATPAEAGLAALDRTGSRCVISGDDFLALWECGPPSRQLAAVRISAPLLRLAVDGDLVLGALAAEDDGATLQAWQGPGLAAAPGSVALGPTAVDQLLLDGARGRGLVTGLRGPQSRFGEGEFLARLYDLRAGTWSVLWQGEGGPSHPNGFLFPLAGGALGAYDRKALTVLRPAGTSGGGPWQPAARHAWGDLEQVVASPSGTFAAWFWSDGGDDNDDQYRARVAELGKGEVIHDLTIERVGEFPALAVDDEGVPRLVFGERPDRLVICELQSDALRPGTTIDIPRAGAPARP